MSMHILFIVAALIAVSAGIGIATYPWYVTAGEMVVAITLASISDYKRNNS